MRYQAVAEREAEKYPSVDGVGARQIERICVLGAGTMGSSIAIAGLDAGFDVALLEKDGDALQRGVERIHRHYQSRVKADKISVSAGREREAKPVCGLDWSLVSTADLVIEAVIEDLTVKQEVVG